MSINANDPTKKSPVITIAREFSCPAKKVATRLTTRLNSMKDSKVKKIPWRWINKEILSESARELNLDPSDIDYVFKYEKKNGVITIDGDKQKIKKVVDTMFAEDKKFKGTGLILFSYKDEDKNEENQLKYENKKGSTHIEWKVGTDCISYTALSLRNAIQSAWDWFTNLF